MRVVCAWCNKILAKGKGPVSHGICPECRDKVLGELKKDEGIERR